MATKAEIMAEDRHRISTILESPEGLRNPDMARRLAIERGMDARDAVEILRSAPAANPYLAAMDAQGGIGIGAPVTATGLSDPKDVKRAELAVSIGIFNRVNGYGRRAGN